MHILDAKWNDEIRKIRTDDFHLPARVIVDEFFIFGQSEQTDEFVRGYFKRLCIFVYKKRDCYKGAFALRNFFLFRKRSQISDEFLNDRRSI